MITPIIAVCLSFVLSVSRITHKRVYGCQPKRWQARARGDPLQVIKFWYWSGSTTTFALPLTLHRQGCIQHTCILTRQRAPPCFSPTMQQPWRSLVWALWAHVLTIVNDNCDYRYRSSSSSRCIPNRANDWDSHCLRLSANWICPWLKRRLQRWIVSWGLWVFAEAKWLMVPISDNAVKLLPECHERQLLWNPTSFSQ